MIVNINHYDNYNHNNNYNFNKNYDNYDYLMEKSPLNNRKFNFSNFPTENNFSSMEPIFSTSKFDLVEGGSECNFLAAMSKFNHNFEKNCINK